MAQAGLGKLLGTLLSLGFLLFSMLSARGELIAEAPPGQIESGVPAFVTYSREALGLTSPCSDIRRLPDGRIILASQRELVLGDGVRWTLIAQDPKLGDLEVLAESIAFNDRGELFAGMRDGFGRIEFTQEGRWRFQLVEGSSAEQTRLRPAFQVAAKLGDNWYWHSWSGAVLRWNLGGQGSLEGGVDNIDSLFLYKGLLHASNRSDGSISRLGGGETSFVVPPSETDLNRSISCTAPYAENVLLAGTTNAGLLLFDGRSLKPLVTGGLLAGGRRINDLCQISGRYYAAAVDTYGVVFFDRAGRIVQTLDRSLDHRLSRVRRLLYTPEGVLWALLHDGVTRIEFPSKISSFEALLQTSLGHVEPIRHEGKLWLHADGKVLRGVYDSDQRLVGFEPDGPPVLSTWKLSADTGRLLVSSAEGIFERTPAGWTKLVSGLVNARILKRTARAGWWIFAARGQLGLLRLEGEPVVEAMEVPWLGDTYGAVVDRRGVIWLELGVGAIARIDPSSAQPIPERLGRERGVPDSWASLYAIDGELRLNSSDRVLRYDETVRRFVEDTELVSRFPSLVQASGRVIKDASGRLWMNGPDSVLVLSGLPDKKGAVEERLPPELHPHSFVHDSSGVVWMFDRRSFIRYDPSMPDPEVRRLRAVLQRIDLPELGRSHISPQGTLPDFPASVRSLSVHFCAPGAPMGIPVNFEFMLEGGSGGWTPAGAYGSAVLNRLSPGHHVLRVRPVTLDGTGGEAQVAFTILPPWYRTPSAYLAGTVLVLSGLGLAVLLPLTLHKRHKRRLEQLVFARTQQLNDTNVLLEGQIRETLEHSAALEASEERFRKLSSELERRVEERTDELSERVKQVEELNHELRISQRAADSAASRLQEANANLMVANQELESFSYSVSHDLRAPLRNMAGFIELLKRRIQGLADKECQRYTEIIGSEATRMGALIDDLLTFSRIGRAEMRRQTVRIEDLISQVRNELAHDLAERRVEWRLGPLPEVIGDETLLRQVLANLIGNAVKFTRGREPAVIEIVADDVSTSDMMVTFRITDNGVGFNPQYSEKLFNVFQRLHSSREFEGTGIGLANVKRIITRHGGRVWATGTAGQGASFFFTLKRAS